MRQVDLESGATVRAAGDRDVTVVAFDDAEDDRQAEAGTLFVLLVGEEGFEDFLLGGFIHTVPGVGNGQQHIGAGGEDSAGAADALFTGLVKDWKGAAFEGTDGRCVEFAIGRSPAAKDFGGRAGAKGDFIIRIKMAAQGASLPVFQPQHLQNHRASWTG